VGSGSGTVTGDKNHALLWASSAATAVDLHPATGFTDSFAYGTDGTRQVGYGTRPAPSTSSHALLWAGSAGSAVDLHPGSFASSRALSVAGGQQVRDPELPYVGCTGSVTVTGISTPYVASLLPNR
jgi:hypothetical protein